VSGWRRDHFHRGFGVATIWDVGDAALGHRTLRANVVRVAAAAAALALVTEIGAGSRG